MGEGCSASALYMRWACTQWSVHSLNSALRLLCKVQNPTAPSWWSSWWSQSSVGKRALKARRLCQTFVISGNTTFDNFTLTINQPYIVILLDLVLVGPSLPAVKPAHNVLRWLQHKTPATPEKLCIFFLSLFLGFCKIWFKTSSCFPFQLEQSLTPIFLLATFRFPFALDLM